MPHSWLIWEPWLVEIRELGPQCCQQLHMVTMLYQFWGEHYLCPYLLQFGRMSPTLGAIGTHPLWELEETRSNHIKQSACDSIHESHQIMHEILKAKQNYNSQLFERTWRPLWLCEEAICLLKVPPRVEEARQVQALV